MEIEDYNGDKDSNFSFDLCKTLDQSNRNVNSIAEYSSIGEDEEYFIERQYASASSNISTDYFIIDPAELVCREKAKTPPVYRWFSVNYSFNRS